MMLTYWDGPSTSQAGCSLALGQCSYTIRQVESSSWAVRQKCCSSHSLEHSYSSQNRLRPRHAIIR